MAVHRGRGEGRRPGAGGPGVGGADGIPEDVANRMRGGKAQGYGGGGYEIRVPGQPGGPRVAFNVGLPSVEKPAGSSDFNIFGTLAGRTAANTPAQLASFAIPANTVAVIRSISILANGLLVTSNILWALKFNDSAVSGWNTLTINPRAAGSVEVSWTPEETFIRVPEGTTISFDATVLDGGTYQVSVSAHGWFYSTALDAIAASAYPTSG